MVRITKKFTFDAAHILPWHEGKCHNLHGHTYLLEVTVAGDLNENGIVMDFGDLKKIVNEEIIDRCDHKDLNTIFANPTAEIMARDFMLWLNSKDDRIVKVRLYETPTSYAEAEI